MKRKILQRTVFVLILSFMTSPAAARDIVIGSVNEDPKEEIELFLPLARYLGEMLHEDGVEQGRVVVSASMNQMAEFLKNGVVDLYIDSPYPALNVSSMSGGDIILRRWKNGVSEYRSVIFTQADSPVKTLQDLKGRLIAFEEPWSSSSYFLPRQSLLHEGFKLSKEADFRSIVDEDEVGYVFSDSDANTFYWVLMKRVAAGAMSEAKLDKHAGERIDEIRILHTTKPIPRQVVMHRADLDPALVERIILILTGMDESAEGRKVLQEFENTERFDQVPVDSLDLLREGLMEMKQLDER